MATPLYVIKALAKVRDSGLTDMLDRDAVEMTVWDQRAAEWLNKASNNQYTDALNDMGAAESDDWTPPVGSPLDQMNPLSDFPGVELDPISGLPEYLFRNDEEELPSEQIAALEEEGRKLAVKHSWDGYNILVIAQAALTDANFHKEAEIIGEMIKANDVFDQPQFKLEVIGGE